MRISEARHFYTKEYIKNSVKVVKELPCEQCLSYAICINLDQFECEDLWSYLMTGRPNMIRNAISLFKSYTVLVYAGMNISFVTNMEFASKIIESDKYSQLPIIRRITELSGFRYHVLILRWFSIWRHLRNRYKRYTG